MDITVRTLRCWRWRRIHIKPWQGDVRPQGLEQSPLSFPHISTWRSNTEMLQLNPCPIFPNCAFFFACYFLLHLWASQINTSLMAFCPKNSSHGGTLSPLPKQNEPSRAEPKFATSRKTQQIQKKIFIFICRKLIEGPPAHPTAKKQPSFEL